MQVWSAVLVLLSIVATVHCYSTGAPAAACADIYPVGHSGTSQDLSTNPFQLSLSDFDETYGGEFYYVPGQQYTCELYMSIVAYSLGLALVKICYIISDR